jgi:hypothetical protein
MVAPDRVMMCNRPARFHQCIGSSDFYRPELCDQRRLVAQGAKGKVDGWATWVDVGKTATGCDYYGHSVSVEVALGRRIPCSATMRRLERNVGASLITFLRPHWPPSLPRGYPERLLHPRYRKASSFKRSARGRGRASSVIEVRAILPSPYCTERGSP